MAGAHSRFAPSSAHRVIECPASLLLNEQEPDEVSFFAVEGTIGHYIHERALLYPNTQNPHSFVGKRPFLFMHHTELTLAEWRLIPDDFTITAAFAEAVEESVLRCREAKGDYFIEQRVDISQWCPVPDQKGTADFFACSPGHLDVRDLKMGEGVQVYAERNYQAILYALGVIAEHDWLYEFETVDIWIHQPRLDHYDVWHTTKAELLAIGEHIKQRFALALQPNAPFGASEHACRFCKVVSKCPHLAETVLSYFDFEEDATMEDVKTEAAFLSQERQVEIYRMRGLFKMWIGAIEGDIEAQLKRDPKGVPGLRLVNGLSYRQWANKDQARDELMFAGLTAEQIYKPQEMISPAVAEKLGRKAIKPLIAELTVKPLGKPVVVDEFDPRPDYINDNSAIASRHFDVEDEG